MIAIVAHAVALFVYFVDWLIGLSVEKGLFVGSGSCCRIWIYVKDRGVVEVQQQGVMVTAMTDDDGDVMKGCGSRTVPPYRAGYWMQSARTAAICSLQYGRGCSLDDKRTSDSYLPVEKG